MTEERVDITIPVGRVPARAVGPADGELVLLLHGFPQSSFEWRHQLATLGAAGYRAVAYDQRGYAPAARPTDLEAYRVEELAGDVLAVADSLGADRFHLVGHDWGAIVGWHVAAKHPGRLRSWTAVSVPHPRAFGRAFRGEGGSDQHERSSYFKDFSTDGTADRLVADDAAGLRFMFSASGLEGHDVEDYVRVLGRADAMQAALNWYKAMDSRTTDVPDVTVPTMFVWSTDDPALGPEGARMTKDHVTGPYRFEVLEGVPHWIPELAPADLDRLLLEHLAV